MRCLLESVNFQSSTQHRFAPVNNFSFEITLCAGRANGFVTCVWAGVDKTSRTGFYLGVDKARKWRRIPPVKCMLCWALFTKDSICHLVLLHKRMAIKHLKHFLSLTPQEFLLLPFLQFHKSLNLHTTDVQHRYQAYN